MIGGKEELRGGFGLEWPLGADAAYILELGVERFLKETSLSLKHNCY